MRILIVDDDIFRRVSLQDYLVSSRVALSDDLFIAADTAEAADILGRYHFDVLILDVVLPLDKISKKASSKNGLDLLNKIIQTDELRKPTKIIGITAHIEDLGRFKKSFERDCLIVIEANRKTIGWKAKIANFIGYDELSRKQRIIQANSINVITIHGIRTFGKWQLRLEKLVQDNLCVVPFHSYKYGHSSIFSILSTKRHAQEIEDLSVCLRNIFSLDSKNRFIIFSHSFGSYLVVEALRNLASSGMVLPIKTVVLSGSVLSHKADLSFLAKNDVTLVNDCGERDYALWFSEAFAPKLGMAGKIGFYGVENRGLINRFFKGGHSSYFDGDDFMKNHWIPLLDSSEMPVKIDSREGSAIENDLMEVIILRIGKVKNELVRMLSKICR